MADELKPSPARSAPRVLVVPSSYFAADRTVGGGERYALEYARALAHHTPTTLALFDRTPGLRREGPLQLRTFEVRGTRDRIRDLLPAATRRGLAPYDVVHLMVFPTPLTDQILLLARLRGQVVVLTDVGGGRPSLSTYLGRIHPRLSLTRLAHGLAPLSAHAEGQFAGWPQPRTVLYGGARVPDPPPAAGKSPNEPPYALFVGRLLPHKGVLELIEAMDPAHPLRVVGRPYDPAYLHRLRSAAEGRDVEFHLDADDAALDRHYRGARLVLQPSLPVHAGAADTSELLGLVTLEGMAYGKPVVVTGAGSLPELVEDGVTGFVVPPGDRAALGDRIARLMEDAELAERLGRAGRERVAERFTWDGVASRGLALYDRLLETGT